MQKNIHPQYNKQATVSCACGNTFTTGSTIKDIKVELCHKCHPFYTGKQRIVDSENLVKKFKNKQKAADPKSAKAKKKKKKERRSKVKKIKAKKTVTLKDMLSDIQEK